MTRYWLRVDSDKLPPVWFDDPGLAEQYLGDHQADGGNMVLVRVTEAETIIGHYGTITGSTPWPKARVGKDRIQYDRSVKTQAWNLLRRHPAR